MEEQELIRLKKENERLKAELNKAERENAFNQSLREMWLSHLNEQLISFSH